MSTENHTQERLSVDDLGAALSNYIRVDKRKAAEIAYAWALVELGRGNLEKAKECAVTSVEIFRTMGVRTPEESISLFASINGIPIPRLTNASIVLEALRAAGLSI